MRAQPSSDKGRETLLSDLRRIDQMLSMEAALRDRKMRLEVALTVVVLVSSAAAAALAFAASDKPLGLLGIEASSAFIVALLGLAAFVASLLDLVLRQGSKARAFATSVGQLTTLKLEYRELLESTDSVPYAQIEAARRRYAAVMATVEAIPESQFNRLKAQHLRKVEISKLLSAHPGEDVRTARRRLRDRNRANTKRKND